MTKNHRFLSILALTGAFVSCGFGARRVAFDDPDVQPLLVAVAKVDRAALGFTPLSRAAELRLQGASRNYDAMLHVYGDTSRTIAFRRVGPGRFRWIGEQETHTGPREYSSPDGPFREHITITYDTEKISGAPVNTVYITYVGEDPALSSAAVLTLKDVAPVLQRWYAVSHGGA